MGSNILSNLQFKLHQGDDHILEAHTPDGEVVGHMRWRSWDGVIRDVSVDPAYRRQGIATKMFAHANDLADLGQATRPVHSAVRTDEGLAWSQSLEKKGNNA